jgi:UDP-2-acetamido-3-amino-2,3-dideoxy-glucuronate N-acetyltransferase
MRGAHIGRGCTLGQNVFIGENVRIGNNVKLSNNVSIFDGVEIENNVFCGPSVTFTNVKTPRTEFPVHKNFTSTLVRRGTSIGANATIICGVTLGEYAFVGAGAVVTKDIPSFGLVYGNPARHQGFVCVCGQRLIPGKSNQTLRCSSCDRRYVLKNAEVQLLK